MLVLSRRESEWIKIGDSVTITVVRLGSDKVRIGIEAPSDVLILRGELEQRETSNHNEEKFAPGMMEVTFPVEAISMIPSTPTSLAG